MSLDQISRALGEGTAERDVRLDQVFVPTADYREVTGMTRTLILGERGAGKSAIFRRMRDHPEAGAESKVLTVPLAADQVSWPALEQAARAANNKLVTLSREWELTLLLLAFDKLLDERRDVKRKRLIKDLDAEISKIFRRTELGLTSEGTLSEVFGAAATMLRNLPFTFKVQAPFVPVSVELKDSDSKTPEEPEARAPEKRQTLLVEGMYGIVTSLLDPSLTVQILVDQLDEFWNGSTEQIASLVALIYAVMRIKNVLLMRGMDDDRLGFVVFLRSDIYAVLKDNGLDDASKYVRSELHLKWDKDALQGMVERRLEVAEVEGIRGLNDLFADDRIGGGSLITYFFSRLAPRPRDAIVFLGFCLDEARMRGEDQISAEALRRAEVSYSGWRKGTISEEIRYGGLRSADEVLDSLSSGPRSFTPKELRRHLDDTKRDYNLTETKPQIMSALVEWGVLGVKRSNGTVFIWDVPEGQRPSPREDDEGKVRESYIVHPSLWSVLDLRHVRKPRAGG